MLRQFDKVQLLDTKQVTYLSAPPGNPTSPHGYWSVVGFKDGRPVLAKESTTIVTSLNNIKKIASYNIDKVFESLHKVSNKYRRRKK